MRNALLFGGLTQSQILERIPPCDWLRLPLVLLRDDRLAGPPLGWDGWRILARTSEDLKGVIGLEWRYNEVMGCVLRVEDPERGAVAYYDVTDHLRRLLRLPALEPVGVDR